MSHRFWLAVTVAVSLAAAWAVARAALPNPRAARGPRAGLCAENPLLSEAGVRWRHGEPTHWRACLLRP